MSELETRGWIPTDPLPEEAADLLSQSFAQLGSGESPEPVEVILERARAQARAANAESMRNQRSLPLVDRLARANALVAAAASLSEPGRFPMYVAVAGYMGVPNLLAALARRQELKGDHDGAVDLYSRSLALMKRFVVYAGVDSVSPAFYWTMSRVAEVVGRLAVERRASIANALDALDRNVLSEYGGFVRDADISGPRAFAVISLLRHALLQAADVEYLSGLAAEAEERGSALRPTSPAARERFDRELQELSQQLAERLGHRTVPTFRW